MLIIEIASLPNGGHQNQTTSTPLSVIPDGWAVVPSALEIPDTFPFVNIEVDGQTVTSMTAEVVPEPEPEPESVPTLEDRMTAMEDAVKRGLSL